MKKAYKNKLMVSVYEPYDKFFGYERGGKAIRKMDAKNDLYVYFYLHGLSLLNKKGSFCFVTSNSWLDVGYGRDLQEFLIKTTPIKMIIDNQVKRSFKSASINTIISLFGKPYSNDNSSDLARFVMFKTPFEYILDPVIFEEIEEAKERTTKLEYRVVPKLKEDLLESGTEMLKDSGQQKVNVKPGKYTGDKWGGKYLRAPDIYYTILEKAGDKLVRLGDIAEVRRGFTTGANEFFYLTKEKIAEWGIEEEFLKPVFKSPKESNSILINPNNLKFNIFMCHENMDQLAGTSAIEYIEWGESRGFHNRPSCRGRKRWWDLGERRKSPLIFPCGIRETFRIFLNDNVFIDKRLYEIYSDSETLIHYLNSTLTPFFIELNTRNYGGGGGPIDATVYEVEDILVLDSQSMMQEQINITRPVKNIFFECGMTAADNIRSQEPNPVSDRRAVDEFIFDAIGLSQDERNEVYWAVGELVQKRLEKAKSV